MYSLHCLHDLEFSISLFDTFYFNVCLLFPTPYQLHSFPDLPRCALSLFSFHSPPIISLKMVPDTEKSHSYSAGMLPDLLCYSGTLCHFMSWYISYNLTLLDQPITIGFIKYLSKIATDTILHPTLIDHLHRLIIKLDR